MTVAPRPLILEAARRLREAGVPDPAWDASVLLSHLTGRPPLELRLDTDTELPPETAEAFRALLVRRCERVPLQWLTGEQEFLGHRFRVTPDVLIPRPETALLARRAIDRVRQQAGASLLDLCCGSGCIAVSVALACPSCRVYAADLSDAALRTARENAASLGAAVRFSQGDLFGAVGDARFDCIVSNPPYIPTADCAELQEEVRREPLLALDGGPDGLRFYRAIAAEAGAHLNPGGTLLLEIGAGQAEDVPDLLRSRGFTGIAVFPDLSGIPRIVEARRTEDLT
ncbi:MAG: peptide chain release factor N(5)-glutamine methyltransferase [Clostridia bacterium]|nr:peptide chain release factor N(5)-glutamine methyltransferase [Clostridia bacterium]